MSGGSYNYLCFKDASELLSGSHSDELRQMVDRLAGLGYEDAAKSTEELIAVLSQCRARIQARVENLSSVFKAVEWMDSGDSVLDNLESVIEKWRSK